MAATVRSSSTYASAATEASFSVPLPSGFAAADVCYIFAEGRAASGVFGTAPAGWTAVAASFASGATTSSFMVCYRKVMTGSEGNPTVTGTSGRYSAVAVAVQGADNGTPEDVAVIPDNGGASAVTTITSPGITPSSSSALLLIGFGCGTPAGGQVITYSTPSGMTLAASTSTTVAAVTESGMMAAWQALSSNAATGTRQTTITPSAIDGQTVTIAVRPAAAAPPIPYLSQNSGMF